MCGSAPASLGEAVAAVTAGLRFLARADAMALGQAGQAECLQALEAAEAVHTAARVSVLAAFHAAGGGESDGCMSTQAWLMWRTRISRGAARGAIGWMRRLRGHRPVWEALADGAISVSWARRICDWTGRLPEASREDADAILLAAAAGGATFADLAALAHEMYLRSCPADEDRDPFEDRSLFFAETAWRAGRLEADLTPAASAALRVVLDSLGAKAGPEDTRSKPQREHDALEEACIRLIASGMLPQRAGQPVALACDATIFPVVTGTVDDAALDELVQLFLSAGGHRQDAPRGSWSSERLLRRALLAKAADVLSGPGGLAAALRANLAGQPYASVSLPLDVGQAVEVIPGHLRRAVIFRDRRCRFPGCSQPPAACQVHHLIHREDGGPTSLENCCLLCRFHHLIVIHRWHWELTLHPDGTATATSPSGRVLHSHGPPAEAA